MKPLYLENRSRGLLEQAFKLIGEMDGEEGTTYEEAQLALADYDLALTARQWKILEQMFCSPETKSGVESAEGNPWFFNFTHDYLEKLGWVDGAGRFQKEGYARFKQKMASLKGEGLETSEAGLEQLARRYEFFWQRTNGIERDENINRHPLLPQPLLDRHPKSDNKNWVVTFEPFIMQGMWPYRKAHSIADDFLGLKSTDYFYQPTNHWMAGMGWTVRDYPFSFSNPFFVEGSARIGPHNSDFYATPYQALQTTHWALAGHLASGYTFFKTNSQPVFRQMDIRLGAYGFVDDRLSGRLLFPPVLAVDEKLLQVGRFVVNASAGLQTFTGFPFYEVRTGFEF